MMVAGSIGNRRELRQVLLALKAKSEAEET